MVETLISSITVDFPYDPYPAQVRYMSKVIEALRSGQNGLLESPTGTGKTLCLLCAALAWRSTYIAALQAHTLPINSNPAASSMLMNDAGLRLGQGAAGGTTSALDSFVKLDAAPQLASPRIVFSSRTHSQLSQAVAELKKTVYNPSISILASRDQLCVHDIASNFSGSRLNAMCRRITAPARRGCRFHLPVASSRTCENRSGELVDKLHSQPPMDIEDLRAFGSRETVCPFFLSRAAARSESCEILFLPYNYLLDCTVRESLDIDWANDIVIIDEAHNLDGICSSSMSFDLSPSTRTACDSELGSLIEKGLRPGGLSIPALENLTKTEKGLDSVIGSENRTLLEIRLIRTILAAIETFVNKTELDRGKDCDVEFKAFPGHHLRNVMEEAGGPTFETYELFLEMLDRALEMQAESTKLSDVNAGTEAGGSPDGNSSGNSAIRILESAIRVLFENAAAGDERCFRTVIQCPTSRASTGRTLSYWCFKPSLAMKTLTHLNLRCLLLTSGTLAPLDTFATELGLPFPIRLENPHVVTPAQVWAGVIRSGPEVNGQKGGRLTSAYFARGENSSVELGRSMIRIATAVPDGLLVFFPSYAAMYTCVDAWKKLGPGADRAKPSIWEHILRRKRIVLEDRNPSKVPAAILAHRANVDGGHGSILLAVCRGKVSEGIDFSDEYGRAVAVTGLPYPSAMDPKVVLKREYADEEARRYYANLGVRARCGGKQLVLNGSQWYSAQALRAVNQAIGRAIRHRFDYGAILLCDERFQSVSLHQQVSKWLRPSIKVHATFPLAETALDKFFVDAATSQFAKEGEQNRLEARKRHEATAASQCTSNEDSTMAVMLAQSAIEKMLPPPKTEVQFLNQLMCFSDDIKAQKGPTDVAVTSASPKVLERPLETLLDVCSQGAQGGLRDSGFDLAAPSSAALEGAKGSRAMKRSAIFLATRTERDGTIENCSVFPAAESSPKRLKRTGNTGRHGQWHEQPTAVVLQRNGCNEGACQKLSEKIKNMFDKRNVRGFLELFRALLDAHCKVSEGVGPLQSARELQRNQLQGRIAIRRLVEFTRDKCQHGAQSPAVESFLLDVKSKIPLSFHRCYDDNVRKIKQER